MIRSLQTRLLLGVVTALIVLLGVFSTSVYWGFRRSLIRQFDGVLTAMADILSVSVELDSNRVDVELEVQRMSEFNNPDLPMNYQVWSVDGQSMAKSPLLGEADLPRLAGRMGESRYYTLEDSDARPIRAISLQVYPKVEGNHDDQGSNQPKYVIPSQDQVLQLVVARDLSGLNAQLEALSHLLIAAALATAVLSVSIGYVIVRQGLAPLKNIAGQIATIGGHDLSARIEATSVPLEIEPIQLRLNDLLARLDTAFQRERRFTSDAAHELRTPLAGLRSILEVCLKRPREAAAYREALCESLAVASEMQVMVENLLALARLEDKEVSLYLESLSLAEQVDGCWRSWSDHALEKGVSFANEISENLVCVSDATYVGMVFTNCLSNAVTYVNAEGKIWVNARVQGRFTEVTFSNTGCTLTPDEVQQCFDPFWRADASRSAAGNHCGLGLALVKRIMRVLGGQVSANVGSRHEFCLTLLFPRTS